MAKKQNTCNRQFRCTDSDGNKKPNTKKKKNEKKRTKKPCHSRTNQNLPLRRRVVSIRPPSKEYTASESSPPLKHSSDAGSSADNCEHSCRWVFVLGFMIQFYPHPPLVFLYLGTTYHDVVEQNRDKKRREETKGVFIAPKMRPNVGCLQVIWVSGSFKRRKNKAHIKNMATPLVPNFKNIGVALLQAQNLINACSL